MDAGKHDQYDWGKSALAPRLDRVLLAASNTAVSAATRSGFDAVDLALNHWQEVLVKYRCALPKTEVLKHRGTLVGWDCRDLTITTEHLSFRDADSDQFDHLNKIPTRLKLPREDVDRVIAASRQAVRENANIQAILHDTRKKAVIFDSVDAPLAYQN
ncbi:hypothetical protein G3A39_36895 [Paraburkholderia aspalathi]|nr:hypothetical protein [Paraburkholderia aspalathi]